MTASGWITEKQMKALIATFRLAARLLFLRASGSALRERPIDRRVNRTGLGDDDLALSEPIESELP
jgi:hypothetical protein